MAVYKIVIEDKTRENFNPVAGQESSSTTSQASSSKQQVSMNDIGLFVAYRQAKPFISQVISNEVQKVSLRTGSSRLQEKANFNHSIMTKVVSFGESVAIGAMTGGVGGAILGAVLNVGHTVINIANNQYKLDISNALENESIKMTNIRAGSQGSRRS